MAKKTYIYFQDELAEKLEAIAAETGKKEHEIIREVLQYFLDAWLEAERAKRENIRRLTGQVEGKWKRK